MFLLGLFCPPALARGQANQQKLVYGGDQEFPPYEYINEQGQADGFNIHLIQALARDAGMAIEVRLGPREERMSDFDRGNTDVMFLSYTEDRASRYTLLDQTWTLAQVVMMRKGLAKYPTGLDDLWGFRIAVDEGSVNHLLLAALPEARRPTLVLVPTRSDQLRAFERGEVDGAAGNHLTMRFLLGDLAKDAVEVPLISRPYHLAVLPGHEASVALIRTALAHLRETGEFDRLVEQYLTTPTRLSWLERYATAVGLAAGIILLFIAGGTAWNRALRRQVQTRTRAVERTERRYRDLVDNASDMIYRTDPFGRFTFVNPVAARILGYDETALLSMKYFELMRPEYVPKAMSFYEAAAKARESTYLEFPVRKKDGSEIWVGQHVRPIVTAGRIEGFQGMARDITDRVIAQAELRAERDFGSAILETAPSLVMVLDAKGHLIRFNRACEELAGVSQSEIAGRPMWEMPFLFEKDRQEIRDGMPRLLQSTAPVHLDRTWLGKSGSRHVIAWTVMALRDPSGATSYLIGTGTDVTTTRELERLKSQFVSMVSHELRTPLTSIRASMQLLVAEGKTATDPEADQLVRIALTNADRLIRIVNDILDMSKIEAGEMMVNPRPAPAGPMVEESIRSVESVARDARVTIVYPGFDDIPDVQADPDRTIQVLINLLSNAVKHAPSGSTVEVSAVREQAMIAIAIQDHGPGIPSHKVDFIFEPFTQLDGSDTRRIAGTGLGLTIARALAEKQGGTIRVASREGEGATFTLTLPLANSEQTYG
jgi:PAS domain S-box-containing protein